MNKKCLDCGFVNFTDAEQCSRCGESLPYVLVPRLVESEQNGELSKRLDRAAVYFLKRLVSAILISGVILCGIYFSLLHSAAPLTGEQSEKIQTAIEILAQRGFDSEVFLLKNTVAFRASDNWLNETTGHEDAYAATNFPFQIVTIYDNFFSQTTDATERAMILLHEARHLQGANEEQAYDFVWRNRRKLGWTDEKYSDTRVWFNVFEATRQNAPKIFRCDFNPNNDCTE